MKRLFIILILLNITALSFSQIFSEETNVPLNGLSSSNTSWGDYDNDGYMDLVIIGFNSSNSSAAFLYRNNGDNTFSLQETPAFKNMGGDIAWGDFNNDGYLDLLHSGVITTYGLSYTYDAAIYENDGNGNFSVFWDMTLGSMGSAEWGDFDNNGLLDILLTGYNGSTSILMFYSQESPGLFYSKTDIGLPSSVIAGEARFGDYNNDNYLDVLCTGYIDNSENTFLYKNNGNGTFSLDITTTMEVKDADVQWADFNADGWLDFVVSGTYMDGSDYYSDIYINRDNGTSFLRLYSGIASFDDGDIVCGDYDNDGYSDIFITGDDGSNNYVKLYRNNQNDIFTEVLGESFPTITESALALGHFNQDTKLDLVVCGDNLGSIESKLFINTTEINNISPNSPTGLACTIVPEGVLLTWSSSGDVETPILGLSYNVRIGSSPGACDIVSPHSLANGKLTKSEIGNAQLGTEFLIKNLPIGTYFWSVQAIDNSFSGSAWAVEQSFSVTDLSAGLVAYYPFSGNANDESGNYNNGVVNNALLAYDRHGNPNSAYYFNGNSGYISVPHSPSIDLCSALSISAWVDSYDNDGNRMFICKHDPVQMTGFTFKKENEGERFWTEIFGNTQQFSALSNASIPKNRWVHYVSTYDGNSLKVYKNGILASSIPASDSISTNTEPLKIGGLFFGGENEAFKGKIDDIRLYNRALSEAEVQAIYNEEMPSAIPIGSTYQDSLALVSLYNSTNGIYWTYNSNWLSGPIDTWYGVTLNQDRRVSSLILEINNLDGYLPPEIGNLAYLDTLSLYSNYLTGSIPTEIGNLSNLKYLCLWSNQLSGTIPVELSYLSVLQYLDLDENQLSGAIPAELGNLSELRTIYLDYNLFTGSIPSSLGNLVQLEILYSVNNQLTGTIPPELGNLSNLIYLGFGGNSISGEIPAEFGNLSQLTYLSFYRNNLTGSLPLSLMMLPNLQTFSFGGNQLSGSIPPEIGNLTTLERLYLWGNQFTGEIPTELGNLSLLTNIELSDNFLTGVLPASFGNLSNLQVLYLWNNQLSGTIPQELGNLSMLTVLALANNEFSGSVPSSFTNLTNLNSLELNHNLLEALPNLSYLPLDTVSDAGLLVSDNYFSFYDLEPNYMLLNYSNKFVPQLNIPLQTTQLNASVGEYVSLNVETLAGRNLGTSNTFYQWFKNGSPVSGLSSLPTFTIESFSSADTGIYTCSMTNSQMPDLTIETEGVHLAELSNLFTEQSISFADVISGSVEWGDFDNDGDLDILLTGYDGLDRATTVSKVYRNDGNNVFTDIYAGIQAAAGKSSWGDYDNDGWLDILIIGYDGVSNYMIVYKNNGNGTFSDVSGNLNSNAYLSGIWADFDNDGDLDILAHWVDTETQSFVYRNDNGIFNPVNLNLPINVDGGDMDAADFDNDGDIDFVVMGYRDSLSYFTTLYRNEGNFVFTDYNAQLVGLINGSVEFGDYNNDAMLDILLSGKDVNGTKFNLLYQNTGTAFPQVASFDARYGGNSSFGDYDNDGDLDILISGQNNTLSALPIVYTNEGNNIFTVLNISTENNVGRHAWADYDNDGDLDFIVSSNLYLCENCGTALYKNNSVEFGGTVNTKPNPPSVLGASVLNNNVTLQWNHDGGDFQSPETGLTYNIKVGTSSGGNEIMSGNSLANGERTIVGNGNVGKNNSYTLKNLQDGTYYWSIQSVDNCFEAGAWSTELSFDVQLGFDSTQLDSLVLVNLYNSTNGSMWTNKASWLLGNLDSWYGIELNSNRRVINIDLYDNNLVGSLPVDIDNLSQLEGLYLNDNQLSGSIPLELGDLQNLSVLYLYNNQFSGNIPPQIGNLSKLQYLALGENPLSGEIPIELTNLTELRGLWLWNNQLGGQIPAGLGNLTYLTYLELNGNNFTGSIPLELGNLSNLESLYLWGNQLSGEIPTEIGNLTNLITLSLSYNLLSGSVPQSFTNLVNLNSLVLRNNQFSGLPDLSYLPLDTAIDAGLFVSDNQFTFYELEPNANHLNYSAKYVPQSKIHFDTSYVLLNYGQSYTLNSASLSGRIIGGTNSSYQWFKNGVALSEPISSPDYTIVSYSDTDEAYYYCEIRNTPLNNLVLQTDSIYITITGTELPPNAPSNLSTSAVSASQIDLSWTDNSDNEDGFYIYESSDGINFYQKDYTLANETIYSSINLTNNTTYYYKVCAYNNMGEACSNINSATTFDMGVPFTQSKECCFGDEVPALTASGTDIKWYDDASLNNLVYSGSSFLTGQTQVGVYTYYVTQTIEGFESEASIATLTIFDLPFVDAGEDIYICEGIAQLNANIPNSGQGEWSISSGNGYLSDINNPKATFTNEYRNNTNLVWGITDMNACYNEEEVRVIYLEIPIQPNIYLKGGFIFICTNPNMAAYQWYKDETEIFGANAQFYVERENFGNYYGVVITNDDGCTNYSDMQYKSALSHKSVVINPMPVTENATITINNLKMGEIQIQVCSQTGKIYRNIIVDKKQDIETYSLDVSGLNSGFYVVKFIYENKELEFMKLIKK